jgi:hypothetical protein
MHTRARPCKCVCMHANPSSPSPRRTLYSRSGRNKLVLKTSDSSVNSILIHIFVCIQTQIHKCIHIMDHGEKGRRTVDSDVTKSDQKRATGAGGRKGRRVTSSNPSPPFVIVVYAAVLLVLLATQHEQFLKS